MYSIESSLKTDCLFTLTLAFEHFNFGKMPIRFASKQWKSIWWICVVFRFYFKFKWNWVEWTKSVVRTMIIRLESKGFLLCTVYVSYFSRRLTQPHEPRERKKSGRENAPICTQCVKDYLLAGGKSVGANNIRWPNHTKLNLSWYLGYCFNAMTLFT